VIRHFYFYDKKMGCSFGSVPFFVPNLERLEPKISKDNFYFNVICYWIAVIVHPFLLYSIQSKWAKKGPFPERKRLSQKPITFLGMSLAMLCS